MLVFYLSPEQATRSPGAAQPDDNIPEPAILTFTLDIGVTRPSAAISNYKK